MYVPIILKKKKKKICMLIYRTPTYDCVKVKAATRMTQKDSLDFL